MRLKALHSARRRAIVAVTVLTVLATVALGRAAGPYEEPADRPVAQTLPPELAKSVYHTVKDPIAADGYMLHFNVNSTFGPYEVTASSCASSTPSGSCRRSRAPRRGPSR
jgi:hypothetical protein